jgi:DUF1009 family protein
MKKILIIVGNGDLPILVAMEAKNRGFVVNAIGFINETSKDIEKFVDSIEWLNVGSLNEFLKKVSIFSPSDAIFAGQIKPSTLFNDIPMDFKLKTFLGGLKDKRADTIFSAVANRLSEQGINLISSVEFLKEYLPHKGIITGSEITDEEWKDIRFGFEIAKNIGNLDIGQTVVVKQGSVLAVEAIEGTDEAIKRGGRLGNGNVVVVKVAKPQQDVRFDVPVVGPMTIESLVEAKADILAIEAEKTLLLKKQQCIEIASGNGVKIVAV